jgi:hypothetical protein
MGTLAVGNVSLGRRCKRGHGEAPSEPVIAVKQDEVLDGYGIKNGFALL